MDNQEQKHSKACVAYAQGLAHPNERALAEAILDGVADETITAEQGFDQKQIDNMRNRLIGAGCDTVEGVAEEPEARTEDLVDESVNDDIAIDPAQDQQGNTGKVMTGALETPSADTDAPKVDGEPQA